MYGATKRQKRRGRPGKLTPGPSTVPTTWRDFYFSALKMGILPSDFWELTFAELAAYTYRHETRERMAWQHTATVCALLVNINKGKGKTPAKTADFYPYDIPERESDVLTSDDVETMRSELLKTLNKKNGS